jgi:polyisoprenyl-teichoic acid--peptidoglycan teichoic acid transferase
MRRRVIRVVLVLPGVFLVLAGAAAAFVYWQAESIVGEFHAGAKRQVVDAARPELDVAPQRSSESPGETSPKARTILLLGSDRRYGDEDRNSDTMLLLRLDPARHRAALLSVPRDLYVRIPGHEHGRVSAAYGLGGTALVIRTLREALGVRINHFFDVDFGGFERVVNAMGGVFVPVDQRYFNRNLGTAETNFANIDLLPGYQRLSGRQALAFVRFRHTDSDSYRASRQQLFLLATAQQALGTRVYDVVRVRRLLGAFAKATTSDVDGLRELLSLADAARGAAAGHVRRYTLPAHDLQLYGADYVEASPAQIRRAVRAWLGDSTRRPAKTGRRTASGDKAQLQLLSDGGAARGLLAATRQWVPCTPTALPSGFYWPGTEAARGYRLAGHPAAALYATRGSGRSLLWMWTTWQHPPILDRTTTTVTRGGREYRLTTVAGRVHVVAWRIGDWRVWITNTLRDELPGRALLKLAATCRRR